MCTFVLITNIKGVFVPLQNLGEGDWKNNTPPPPPPPS